MARLLLDTHVLIWAVADPTEIGVTARRVLTDPSSTVVFSVISLWEVKIKEATGKLVVGADLHEDVVRRGLDVLPVLADHAREVGALPLHHRDPFDRMLVAQARHEGLTLVTADRRLEAYSVAVLRADG